MCRKQYLFTVILLRQTEKRKENRRNMKYANVVVENKSRHTDMFFTYACGDFAVCTGDKVKIPFGKGNRSKVGFVFGTADAADCPEEKIKPIEGIDEAGSLNEEMIKTAAWMKTRYAITYSDAINCFTVAGKPPKEGKEKEPYKNLKGRYTSPEALTEEQQNALRLIDDAIDRETREIFLLHGVTASGKTQVYMEAITRCLEKGKTAVMLVPEISLTNQILERFIGRFGKEQIAVMHSRLTPRERYDEWQRIRSGKAKIVIGARMGVFAPLDNIGIIVMDEEHEASYKSDMTPKYDTVEVAAKRLQASNGVLLMGSATPSVTSYERCREGIYKLITLKERYNKTPLPKVETVDMRQELRAGNMTVFSRRLFEEMHCSLECGEQIILMQNRRGYSNFVSCRECGAVMKCPECDLSLVYHKSSESMVCHYCGRRYPVPHKCPECGSKYIKHFGVGTEQVQEAAEKYFPQAKTARLDLDSVKNRGEMDRILKEFADKKTDILIGTQLVAKGLDFDNVGLVGVIAADVTLNIPDYRSSERTFQLITQVAGRSGRGDKQGLVIVQTYEPENFTYQFAQTGDYEGFFSEEAKMRLRMEYPPFGDIIMVNFTSENEETAEAAARRCEAYMKNALGEKDQRRVLSPKVSLGFKGKDSFRQYLIVKCPRSLETGKSERNRYMFYLENFEQILLSEKIDVSITVDVNPYSIF